MTLHAVQGPLLVPEAHGAVAFHPDGMLAYDDDTGILSHVGPSSDANFPENTPHRHADGVLCPPFLDLHTHIPQHPIRGRFTQGVPDDAPEGKLLAGLNRNVFPQEQRCADPDVAAEVVDAFLADTRAHGVLGGAAYVTSSPAATRVALERLPETWHLGLVLMNQHCPHALHLDADAADVAVRELAEDFGPRVIVTDRFAVAVDTPLRQRQSRLAGQLGLRTQTHLNEQVAEKRFVEQTLYPDAPHYAGVYHRDGLLDHRCILAHCIHMTPAEWDLLADTGSTVAHCPTSNQHLGSGVMPLHELKQRGLPYALATDVGASPTVSMLAEMARFLHVHADHPQNAKHATPTEALFRSTTAPAHILGLHHQLATLAPGRPATFLELKPTDPANAKAQADDIISALLPSNLHDPGPSVLRVTQAGHVIHTING